MTEQRDGIASDEVKTARYTYWSNGSLRKQTDANNQYSETFYDSGYQTYPVCVLTGLYGDGLRHSTTRRYYGVPGSADPACLSSSGSAAWDANGVPVSGAVFGLLDEEKNLNQVSMIGR